MVGGTCQLGVSKHLLLLFNSLLVLPNGILKLVQRFLRMLVLSSFLHLFGLNGGSGRGAILPKALFKELSELGIGILPLVKSVYLQGSEVVTRALFHGER